ncbi:GerAB/ArcD/ProY family transporter [Paenibacillus sp. LHD-117]|uniref:GerAB/ArcD/ProY family transporter n=1 Tax=Paenibacillus sp. LHD-117 TaxID=3071412 RepID=UPI0027DF90CF|nr:GerAB/ArcD/ProY family transporter [Paenibacillus sp. LHD-117]MDQ6419011.1 GerAB/ArcD/ProY family transporter [Paenibacillus sp. LHD-117]
MVKTGQVVTMYILTHMGMIFFLYPTDIIESVDVGHWIAICFGYLLHVTIIWIYMKGLSCFDRRSVIDIFAGLGKPTAALLLVPVFLYLLMVLIITTRAYAEIITLIFLSDTPLWATIALMLTIATFMSMLGIEALLRTGILLFALCLPFALFVLAASFQHADWHYVVPAIDRDSASLSFVFSQSFLKSLFAFGGGFLFLGFVQPSVTYERRKIGWYSLILLPLFLISVYVPILTFGQNTASTFQFPFMMATDTVEINWLMFERTTMFFMLSMITFIMIFLALVMWKSTLLITSFFPVRPLYPILVMAGALFVICMQISDWWQVERLLGLNTFLRLYVMTVIPVATLLLGLRHKKKGALRHHA